MHKYFYEICYIENGLATYIDILYNKRKAVEHVTILNNANRCLNKDTKFVLDKYRIINENERELIEEDITNEETIKENFKRLK